MSESTPVDHLSMFVNGLEEQYGQGPQQHLYEYVLALDATQSAAARAGVELKEETVLPANARRAVEAAAAKTTKRFDDADAITTNFESRAATLEVEAVHSTYATDHESVAVRSEIRQRTSHLSLSERAALLNRAIAEGNTVVYHALTTDPLGISLAPSGAGDDRDGYDRVLKEGYARLVDRLRPEEAKRLRDVAAMRRQVGEAARRRLHELCETWKISA